MRFREFSNQDVEVDLAPMIDVVFLLLIFFIVTWNFAARERDLDVAVPIAEEGADPEQLVGEIVVNVRKDGTIVVNSLAVTHDDLFARLSSIASAYPNQAVILRGDSGASWQNIADVLDTCRRAKVWNVAFATMRAEDVPPAPTGTSAAP
jgi:biopolymer transport protein ExbD